MVSQGTVCLRTAAHGERGKTVRFGRLLGSSKVTTDRIIEGWGAPTSIAARGRDVLAIQDTCEVKFKTTARRRRGLGEIGKGNIHGLLLHAMVTVDEVRVGRAPYGPLELEPGTQTVTVAAERFLPYAQRLRLPPLWIAPSGQVDKLLAATRRGR